MGIILMIIERTMIILTIFTLPIDMLVVGKERAIREQKSVWRNAGKGVKE